MLPGDIRVIDMGGESWTRLARLARQVASRVSSKPEKGPLLVIYRGLKLLKALDLSTGRSVPVEFSGTSRLDALSRETGFPRVIALEETALQRVFSRAQREIFYDDDLVQQWLAFLRGVAAEWRRTIFTYPPGPRRIAVPPYPVIDRVARLFIPDGSILLVAVTERGKAWASVVLGYRGGEFWLLSSLDTIGAEEGDLTGGALEAAARALGSLYEGRVRAIAVEREAVLRILDSRFPAGALLWAMNTFELRLLNVPLRWKAVGLAAALAFGVKRVNCEFRIKPERHQAPGG